MKWARLVIIERDTGVSSAEMMDQANLAKPKFETPLPGYVPNSLMFFASDGGVGGSLSLWESQLDAENVDKNDDIKKLHKDHLEGKIKNKEIKTYIFKVVNS